MDISEGSDGLKVSAPLTNITAAYLKEAEFQGVSMFPDPYKPVSPEELARRKAARAAEKERRAAQQRLWEALKDRLKMTHAAAVIELHRPDNGDCQGCDFGGWEGEEPAWPCRTVMVLVHTLGLDSIDEYQELRRD